MLSWRVRLCFCLMERLGVYPRINRYRDDLAVWYDLAQGILREKRCNVKELHNTIYLIHLNLGFHIAFPFSLLRRRGVKTR